MSETKHTPEPYSFDGHGVNDANGQRIAKMSECGTIPKYDETQREYNPEFNRVGEMLANAPATLRLYKELLDKHSKALTIIEQRDETIGKLDDEICDFIFQAKKLKADKAELVGQLTEISNCCSIISSRQHAGLHTPPETWSDFYRFINESKAIIRKHKEK